jgi:tetratricopeptide (TPR) repeat protein
MKPEAQSPPVSAWEETVVIPTYVPPAPDRNPMFLEKRVNQGASGRVYPNPLTDRLSNDKVDRPYKAVFLENEYIQLMILPEIGGRIHVGMDKTNNYDFFYHQHVIKPALIGLFGPWTSGGVEFCWPQHHRPSTFTPVDHIIEEHDDGSKTIWLGEHDPMEHTKGMVGICLHPGRAFVEAKAQLYNRTPYVQTFLWWVNVGVHANDQFQVVFPPDVNYVTDHSKRAIAHFPIARELYYGYDFRGVDISWYRNLPVPSSYFAGESRYDFFGGYDHSRRVGLVHIANHHVSPGKKLFTWGTCGFSDAWYHNLTDADGPYAELMAGVYTDNQPDFSWIGPYETRTFSQYWYPVQEIGPPKNANRRVAVNLEIGDRGARVGVYATQTYQRARVRLAAGQQVLFEQHADLAPGAAYVAEAKLPHGVTATDLILTVSTKEGYELIRYGPEVVSDKPLPEVKTPPLPPETFETTEELYLAGLHLEQYRHPTIEPAPYWEEALRRDPGDARNNNALGRLRFRRGEFERAEQHFRRAIKRLTYRNPNPYDGEPYYNLGLALKFQERLDDAYAAFYKATWNYGWQAASFYALAEIDCLHGDLATALEHLDRSLTTNALSLKARALKAAVLRKLGHYDEAQTLTHETLSTDLLDFWSRYELALACRAAGDTAQAEDQLEELAHLMRGQVQTYLDIAFDYAAAGFWEEASAFLSQWLGHRDSDVPIHPMVLYAQGYFAFQQGDDKSGLALYRRASTLPPDYVFSARLEEMRVLQHAQRVAPEGTTAYYYLGNLLYDKQRYEEAVQHWETYCRMEPGFSIPWRNLGLAYYNVRREPQKAKECYLKAFEINPRDARLLFELDQLMKRLGETPAERLARLEQHLDLVDQRDDLSVERVTLYNQTGQYQKALDAALSRRFHPWEGGTGKVSNQYAAAHLLLGRTALGAGDAEQALVHFEAAQDYPESLGEGKHLLTSHAHIYYFSGLAKEALGDAEGARAYFQRAIGTKTDFSFQAYQAQTGFSPVTYYQALALGKLGDEKGGRERLQALLEFATQEREASERADFATSVARFTLFEDDPRVARRIEYTFLTGLAHLGLGHISQAEEAFREVLACDVNHLEAQEELRLLPDSGDFSRLKRSMTKVSTT